MALLPSWILVLQGDISDKRDIYSFISEPEQRVTDLELEFGFEVLHVRDLGPIDYVLQHLVRLVESVLCGE